MDFRPSYKIINASSASPVSYQEAADHLRVDSDADEIYITELVSAAREYVEGITGRSTVSATYRLTAPDWDSITTLRSGSAIITLDRAPLVSVASIKYIAAGSSSLTTIAAENYSVVNSYDPGAIYFASSYALPTPNPERPDAIQIDFIAGHTDATTSPPLIRHAIKMLTAHWYENRITVAPVNLMPIPNGFNDIIHNQRQGGQFA